MALDVVRTPTRVLVYGTVRKRVFFCDVFNDFWPILRALCGAISRDPEQAERRALLGQREHFLGSISYIDTPPIREALPQVFKLFIQRPFLCQNLVESTTFWLLRRLDSTHILNLN